MLILRRSVLAALLLVPLLLACGADSVGPGHQANHGGIEGFVHDGFGQPLANASIGMLFDVPVPEANWPPGAAARIVTFSKRSVERQPDNALYQNYPNPSNPTTTFRFTLVDPRPSVLSIRNLRGETVRTLFDYLPPNEGNFEVIWDGRDDAGSRVPQGCYSARLQIGIGENQEIHEVDGISIMILSEDLWEDFAIVSTDAQGRFSIPAELIPVGDEVPLTGDSPQEEAIHTIGYGMWLTCVHADVRELVPVQINSNSRDVFVDVLLEGKDELRR